MDFLIKPCSFLCIIFFTYFLKKVGVLKKEYAMIVLKILMNVTLPATVVTVFGSFQRNVSLCSLVVLGLCVSLGPFLLMYLLTRKMDKGKSAYYMICSSGFNIGCYGLPIIQAFYGATGAMISILFDIGNAIMMTSGNFAFTTALLKTEEEKIKVSTLFKKFFSSVPVDTYLILFVACMAGFRVPAIVVEFVSPIAAANAFLAMFMLGLLFEPGTKLEHWIHAIRVLLFRYGIGIAVAILCFCFFPFSLEIRKILVLLLLCPIGAMAPGFVEKCGGDGRLAAFTNSLSTVVSLILMTALVGIFERM